MAKDHDFVPGPPPEGVKPCECEDDICTDLVAWCQVCGAGKDAYQHLEDLPGDHQHIVAGDIGDSAESH